MWRISTALTLVMAVSADIITASAAAGVQAVDRSQPPRVETAAGGFTVVRLDNPVTIDGKTWTAVKPISEARTLRAPNGQFAITLEEATSVEVVHFRVWFTGAAGPRVQLDPGNAVYAFITPDSRWIISGTLEVVDVRNWRAYSLSKVFNIQPYVILRAVSRDGRRLFISQQPCPFDCQGVPGTYYEIGLPGG